MEDWGSENLYYRGSDLMESQRGLLYRKIKETIDQEQGEIAQLLLYTEKNSQHYLQMKKKLESLVAYQGDPESIQNIRQQIKVVNEHQNELLINLQPKFHELFEKVASESPGGLGYNEALRERIRFDLIFGPRSMEGSSSGSREQYRRESASKDKEARYQKRLQELAESRRLQKQKVILPHDHRLLTSETYPKLHPTIMTHIDNAVDIYKQKFLRDGDEKELLQGLLNQYFLFILMQVLVQGKVVIDAKRPQSDLFLLQFIEDCKAYVSKKYAVDIVISPEIIKKKLFHTIDEKTKPLEILYKHSLEEDLLERERYFNDYYLTSKNTSVDKVRRQVMQERKEGSEAMEKGWELLNPAYHAAKDKKKRILATLDLLDPQQSEDNQIAQVIQRLKQDLEKTEDVMKMNVVFEEDPPVKKDPESLVKIRQKHLKRYQVPIQYRKIFGLVINRLNNLYQVKTNLLKKARKSNEHEFERLLNSDQSTEKILYHLKAIITDSQIQSRFEEKRQKKQDEKIQRIRVSCEADLLKVPGSKKASAGDQLRLDL